MNLLSKYSLIFLALFTCAFSVHAQRLQFDVELKVGGGIVPVGEETSAEFAEYYSIQAGAHLAITQHLALGGFYSRAPFGNVRFQNSTTGGPIRVDSELNALMYALDLRLSSGRARRWRPYFSASFGKAEFVQHMSTDQPYRLAATSTLIAVNSGLMVKFGRNFYWLLAEVSGKYLPDRIFWLDSDLCIEVKTGFLYHIRLKSK